MFKFAHPQALFLYILLVIVAGIYFVAQRQRKKALRRYGSPELLGDLMPEVSNHRPAVKFWITFVALCFMVLLLARPQFGTKMETVKRQGIETVIALDISNSMLAEDVAPNRLELKNSSSSISCFFLVFILLSISCSRGSENSAFQ